MNNNFIINLDEDVFFSERKNVGLVEIVGNRIMISLSKQALLGFGKQLIHLAELDYQNGYHLHVDPCEKGHTPQALGFFSHPNSVELIIACSDFDSIDKYIE